MKTQTEWKNLHGEILAEKDQAKAAEMRRKSVTAEYFLSSVCSIASTGEIVMCYLKLTLQVVCDLTGSRTGAFNYAAGNLIIVAGTNKVVKTVQDAMDRMEQFCLPVESARARAVYKVPGSAINNVAIVKGNNPWGKPGRVHVILVKESLGF